MDIFVRSRRILGAQAMEKLKNARVAIFGVGGVGGHAAEAIARSGVYHLDLIDGDTVADSNLNRQIIATVDTIGQNKVDVMKARILSINPQAQVNAVNMFYLPENADEFSLDGIDFVVDCVDTVAAKIEIISRCKERNIPVISAMGAGNKLDPAAFQIADISKTSVCPLARVMRRELKKRGISRVPVAFSTEEPVQIPEEENPGRLPGSMCFAAGAMGLVIAGYVIRTLAGLEEKK